MTSDASDAVPTDRTETPAAIPYADPLVPAAHETGLTSGITRGDVAALAVRIFGIYLLLQALPIAVLLAAAVFGTVGLRMPGVWGYRSSLLPFYAVYFAAFAGVGTWLVLKAAGVAAWLLPRTTGNPGVPAAPGSSHGTQAVAFSIVGMYLAASALPELAAIVGQYGTSDRGLMPGMIKPVAEFAVGLILFFRAERIAAYWQQIGTARPTNPADDSGPL